MSSYTLSILIKAIDDASDTLKKTGKGLDLVGSNATNAAKGLAALGTVGAAVIVSSTLTAARTQELGGVLNVVGGNAGYTREQLAYYENQVKSMGITTSSARQALIQMSQANIDLAQASGLARLAQDAAVIAQIDSSQAFNRLITATQRGSIMMLRTMGITVNFQQAYKNLAVTLGVTVGELTAEQKQAARLNEVMAQGVAIAGTYDGAMDSAGKRMRSMSRHIETAKESLGEAFLPMMGLAVDSVTNLLKAFNALEPGQKENAANMLAIGTAIASAGGAMLFAAPKVAGLASALTGTTVAASAALAPMAAFVAVVAAAMAAVKLYADVQAHQVDVGNAWTQMLKDQVDSGASATDVAIEYQKAQEAVNQEYSKTGILGAVFVNQQEIANASTDDLNQAILDASASVEDYNEAMALLTQTTAEAGPTITDMNREMVEFERASLGGSVAIDEVEQSMSTLDWILAKGGGTFIDTSLSATHLSDVMLNVAGAADEEAAAIDRAAGAAGGAVVPFGGLASSVADLGKAFSDGMPSTEDMWNLILQTERAAGASAEQLGAMAVQMGVATNSEVAAQLATYELIDAYQQGERSMYDVASAASLMQQHTASLSQAETLSAKAALAAEEGHSGEAAALREQANAAAFAAAEALSMAISIAEVGRVEDAAIQTGEDLARSQRELVGDLGEAAVGAYAVRDALNSIPTDIDISIHTSRTSSGGMVGRGTSGEVEGFQHGISYVPYDEFPAILHKGERVLTASENKNFGNTYGGDTYNIVVNDQGAAELLISEIEARRRIRLNDSMAM